MFDLASILGSGGAQPVDPSAVGNMAPGEMEGGSPQGGGNPFVSALGMSGNPRADRIARGALGGGLNAVANNWSKPALAAFAGGAGGALTGGAAAEHQQDVTELTQQQFWQKQMNDALDRAIKSRAEGNMNEYRQAGLDLQKSKFELDKTKSERDAMTPTKIGQGPLGQDVYGVRTPQGFRRIDPNTGELSPAHPGGAPAAAPVPKPGEISMPGQGTRENPYVPQSATDMQDITEGAWYVHPRAGLQLRGQERMPPGGMQPAGQQPPQAAPMPGGPQPAPQGAPVAPPPIQQTPLGAVNPAGDPSWREPLAGGLGPNDPPPGGPLPSAQPPQVPGGPTPGANDRIAEGSDDAALPAGSRPVTGGTPTAMRVRDEAWLAAQPEEVANKVRAVVEHRMAPPTGQSKEDRALRGLVLRYDQNFDFRAAAAAPSLDGAEGGPGHDYTRGAPHVEKGIDVPDPQAPAGRSVAALRTDAEYYLQTGKLPPVARGNSPVAIQQNSYRNAVQNYGNAVAESRGVTPDQAADMWRTAPGMLRFILGADGRATVSLGTAVRHLDTLRQLAAAWDAGDIQLVNKLRAAVSKQFGSEAATNLSTAGKIIGPEIIKALGVAGAGTAEERHAAAEGFGSAASPAQMLGAIDTTQKLLGGQLDGKRRQAAAAGVSEDRFKSLIGERPYEILSKAERGGAHPPPAATDPLSQARAAIAAGAPRDAVMKRLRDNNIDPGGL